MSKAAITQTRDDILRASLPGAAFDGWRWDSVLKAARSAGHETDMVHAVFPGQLHDVLDHFADWADRQMLESLKDEKPQEMPVRSRIRGAVMARLKILRPHREAVRAAAGFWATPPRQICAAKIIWRTSDRIWDWAGDTSDDYNRYTKRALLSGILTTTTLVWFNDADSTLRQTGEFLDRRIDHVLKIGGTLGKALGRFKKGAA